jgi:hypothetical protein
MAEACAVIQRVYFFNPVLRLQNASLYRSLSANDVPSAQSRVKGQSRRRHLLLRSNEAMTGFADSEQFSRSVRRPVLFG